MKLWFNNGEVRVAALSGSFVGPVFEPLRDVRCFMNFKILYNTIEWENIGEMADGHICSCPRCLGYTGNHVCRCSKGRKICSKG